MHSLCLLFRTEGAVRRYCGFFIAINSTKPFFPASLRFRQADSAVFLPHRFPSFIYKRSLRFRFPLFRSHTYGAFESLCSARHPNDINEEVLTFMKKNPIGKYLLQNWYYYVFAFGSMALSVFLDMLAPLVTLHIVDDVLVGHKMELLWKYLAAFLLIGAAKALFQYIKEFLFDVSSVRVASQMRDNLFRHVQRLSVEYFDKNNTGELLARVRDDVDRIWDILGFAGMLILEGLICIMMAMVSMVKLDLPLTLVSVAILPFVAGIAIRLEKELDRVYDAISEENAVMNTVAQENLAGVRTVKSFAREPYEIKNSGNTIRNTAISTWIRRAS